MKRAWIENGWIVQLTQDEIDDVECDQWQLYKAIIQRNPQAKYIYMPNGDLLKGDDDILKNLEECVEPLAQLCDDIGLTQDDKAFMSLARRFIGKPRWRIVSHIITIKRLRE